MSFAASVFPAKWIVAVVQEADGCVGVNRESSLADAFGKRKIFAEIPVTASVVIDHWLKIWCDGFAKHCVTDSQVEFALHLKIHLAPNKQETGRSVHDLQQATADAKADLPSFRQELAGELPPAFFGIEPGDDG